ncbi:MAG: metallopeptidase family protein [Alphaproteobacteria bacterium]|nr:metallopeptidase family protein [Alphaproteobacteria bacterium]
MNDTPPTLDDIEALARATLGRLPARLRAKLDGVVIRVDEFPDDETVAEMGFESPFDLMGLYRGVSLDRETSADVRHDVNMIFLYRRPLLDHWCETEEPLPRLVRHVLIHEIGHHFGLSDDDMARMEAEADRAGR